MPNPIHIRPELRALASQIRGCPLALVSAPAGSGKSTLLADWREQLCADGVATAWIDLAALHEDAVAFFEDLVEQVNTAVPPAPGSDGFGFALRRRLPHLEGQDEDLLARLLAAELRELAEPLVLFLDDYHRLPAKAPVDGMLGRLLRGDSPALHAVVATRGAAPCVAARLRLDGRCLEVGADELSLRSDQIDRLMRSRGLALEPDLLARLLAQTRGWATGVLLALRAFAEQPQEQTDRFVAQLGRREDLFAYIASELLAGASDALVALLEISALLGPVPRAELERNAGGAPEAPALVDEALAKGLLLGDRDRLGLHQLWEAFLRDRLRRRLPPDALAERIDAAARGLDRVGEAERAIELCFEFSRSALAAELVGRHGVGWIERGRHDSVARWLAALGDARVEGDHALELVRALLLGRRDPEQALDALGLAATHARAAGDTDRETIALHGALILAANENLPQRALASVRRLVALPRLVRSAEARARAIHFAGVGALMRGRFALARRLQDRVARHRFELRADRGSAALARGQLAVLAGDWERAISLSDEALADPEQRLHGSSYFALRSLRALARGALDRDPEESIAQLDEACDAFRELRLALSEAISWELAARVLTRLGRYEEARVRLERAALLHDALGASNPSASTQLLLAIALRALGNESAARAHAQRALATGGRRRLGSLPWVGPLAAWQLAEAGDVDAALEIVRLRGRWADTPDLPGSQHASNTAFARVWALAGDESRARTCLARAHAAAEEADLRAPLPDLGAELLGWARDASSRWQLDTARAERFAEAARAARERGGRPSLRIETLGDFRVLRDGEPVEASAWRGAIPQRLLQRLLVARGRSLTREELCVDFWPDAAPAKARGSLRVALTHLRRALEPERAAGGPERYLRLDGERVALTEEALAAWDAHAWTALLEAAERTGRNGDAERALEGRCRAVRAYAGPLLPAATDDWAVEHRRELEERFLRAGRAAGVALLDAARPAEAAEIARALVHHEPADEAAWCLLVRAHLEDGDRSAALRAAEQAGEALRRELDVAPGPELRALARRAAEAAAAPTGRGVPSPRLTPR